MKKLFYIFICLLCISCQNNTAEEDSGSLAGKKILYVYGGWDGHEPVQCRDIFVPWLESEGATVIVSDSLEIYRDKELLASLDLIIQHWTQGSIRFPLERNLEEAVKNGVGLAGWHGGTGDAFRNSTEFQFMVGGQWVAHPGNVIDYDVNIIDHKDPVTKGLNDFHMTSEQYYLHVDPGIKVLATTTYTGEHASWIEGTVMPVVWKKYYGEGRVFYSSLGHVASDFDSPEALEIMKRGIRWAASK